MLMQGGVRQNGLMLCVAVMARNRKAHVSSLPVLAKPHGIQSLRFDIISKEIKIYSLFHETATPQFKISST